MPEGLEQVTETERTRCIEKIGREFVKIRYSLGGLAKDLGELEGQSPINIKKSPEYRAIIQATHNLEQAVLERYRS